MAIIINGRDLTVEEVIRAARFHESVGISPKAQASVQQTRAYVDKKLEDGEVIYGLTTGLGKLSDTAISQEEITDLQRNLIISHACAIGNPFPEEIVRAAMLLRCNSLARGNSGIRSTTLNTLLDMLNKGVHPQIPERGSSGANGDSAPLAHMALTLIGEGQAEYQGQVMPSKEAMEKAGIQPVQLAAKEAMALITGTQFTTAMGLTLLYDVVNLVTTADIAAAMTAEALNGIPKAYDPKVHILSGHQGQQDVAANLRKLLEGSENAQDVHRSKTQDAYSLRCVPQVHGASRDVLRFVYEAVYREINSVTDNPLIFPDEDQVIACGNFHGQSMVMALDFLKLAISEIASISERRSSRLINPKLSEGLAPFLTKHSGTCSGLIAAQQAAASMVSENKICAQPACIDSIPSSDNQADYVSAGSTAAKAAAIILDNTQKILGIELLAASQAIVQRRRGRLKMAPATKAVYDYIRKSVEPMDQDILIHDAINTFDEMVKTGELIKAAEDVAGPLK